MLNPAADSVIRYHTFEFGFWVEAILGGQEVFRGQEDQALYENSDQALNENSAQAFNENTDQALGGREDRAFNENNDQVKVSRDGLKVKWSDPYRHSYKWA